MTMEQMEPPDVRRGREMGGKKKVSEYQMDRYLLGLMSEAERLAFEMMLEVDEAARRQFQRFEALWEAERFDARRHRVPALPVEMAQPRRVWGILRASVGVAVLGLVLWGSRTAFWMSTGMELRVQPYLDAGEPKAAKVSDAKKQDGLRPMPVLSRASMRTKGALDGADVVRAGEPAMVVALLRGEEITQAQSGQRFVTGDRLRLAHRWKRGGYVFWVHREGDTVTPLYPREGKMESVAILSNEMILLPGSLEVSGAIKKEEWLVACFSRRPVSLGRLHAALVSLPKKMDRHALTLCDHTLAFFVRRE